MRIDVSRHPASRRLAHERAEHCVLAESLRHAEGIRIEIEQHPRALHRRCQVSQVCKPVAGVHVPASRTQLDCAGAVRQAQASPVGVIANLLHPGHGTKSQELGQAFRVQWRPIGKAQRQRPALLGEISSPRLPAQIARRHREDLLDARVELPDALEACGECDSGDRHGRRLEQDPGSLGTLGACECKRSRAYHGHELTVYVALGVAEMAGETADALAVNHAIGDQAHCPPDEIRAKIPIRRARRCVRATALASAKAGGLRRRGCWEEAHVLALGRACGTARAAVDPGALHAAEDPAVKARIAKLEYLPETFRIEDHTDTLAHAMVMSGGNRT